MKLWIPARAKGSVKPAELAAFLQAHQGYVAEEKLDGSRYLLYILAGGNMLKSRRISVVDLKPVDKTNNAPHLTRLTYPEALDGVVIDGEIQHPNGFSYTVKCMGSSPERAAKIQAETSPVKYMVFDILQHPDHPEIREMPLRERRNILSGVLDGMKNEHIYLVAEVPASEAGEYFETIVAKGGEGIMLKDPEASYGVGWHKVKKLLTSDVVVTGFTAGKGKYASQIGAVVFSVYRGKDLLEVGQCSGMDDATRLLFTKDPNRHLGTVIEIEAQEFTIFSGGSHLL